jgi:cytochrome c oxidase subunit 4
MSTDADTTTSTDTTTADSNESGHTAHDDLYHHQISDRNYIIIALLLAVLTAMEVAATEVGLGAFLVPALLIMMAIKFFVVVSYFMHLKHDSPIFKFGFYVGLGGALVLYSIMLTTFHFFLD